MVDRRIHLLALPNAATSRAYSLDGFAQATMRFCEVLKRLGYTVFLYGSEENEGPCHELIVTITNEERNTILDGVPYQYAPMTASCYSLWDISNKRMIREIAVRKQPRDFICTIGGASHQSVALAHDDLITIEFSIGYVSSFSGYRVYESHAWRHCTHGWQVQKSSSLEGGGDGRFFDAVIPLFFDPDVFTLRTRKENLLLYVGRLTERKGLAIACQAAQAAGIPLKVIGHGDQKLVTHGAEYLGALDDAARNDWMSRASALICPTQYLEPFGSVAVEAQMCGTPVISTDFGGFVETVEQGVTGYRCNYLGEFVRAIHDVKTLNPKAIRARAERLYSIDAVVPQYRAYFDRLALLWQDGWNTVEAPRLELEEVA